LPAPSSSDAADAVAISRELAQLGLKKTSLGGSAS
jgi:hypothetical protein